MITESVMLQNLCVPCACRCRYCLLSWDGRPVGVDRERGRTLALRFKEESARERPKIKFGYSFGYSMEHPDLVSALRFLKRIGSPTSEYFQCDGMRMRNEAECEELVSVLKDGGVKTLNFTFYGLPEYHDRFAGRRGDFEFLIRMMKAASEAGLNTSAGIPLTRESAKQADALIETVNKTGACRKLFLFVPHSEGRGRTLDPIRFSVDDMAFLSADAQAHINSKLFRPEGEWLEVGFEEETKRSLLISLRADNIERYEGMSPVEIVSEVERLDDEYYASFPSLYELAEKYGDKNGKLFYRQRDLFAQYRRAYAKDHGIRPYDVTDETQSGSRRYR